MCGAHAEGATGSLNTSLPACAPRACGGELLFCRTQAAASARLRCGPARVDFGGGDAVDEDLLFEREAGAHALHLVAVLEVGSPALEYDVGGRLFSRHVELYVGDRARVKVCATELLQVVADDARRLVGEHR